MTENMSITTKMVSWTVPEKVATGSSWQNVEIPYRDDGD